MKKIFKSKKEIYIFIFTALLFLSMFIAVPVLFIPGNTLLFYLSTESIWGLLLIALLSAEISFILTKRIYSRLKKQVKKGFFNDMIAVCASILPGILTCPILAAAVLSFILPISTIWLLVGYRWYIFGLATLLMSAVVLFKIKHSCNENELK